MNQLVRGALAILFVAIAINVAVGLIEAVAGTLLAIMAIVGGVILVGVIVRLWWGWRQANRW
ncbi:hypothetical protein HWD35_18970 [Tsukamurella tyrosinosolvens]|uniref:hypothetical protein n=1 Tax=Tsukamurella tyrosinosolvens TaxID=57704 RepID=UPI001CE0DF80|nr:hypothetical protein [Tsukamurella tyrosinosolvens]MCA4996802.1 hypothetical protein [Tsukamurella tyrosinosolvens]